MNQFKKYEEKLNKNKAALNIAQEFDYILNNIWSTRSFNKGRTRWSEIQKEVKQPYERKIFIEMCHVDLGHGREQALMAVKSEMEKYIEHLLGEEV